MRRFRFRPLLAGAGVRERALACLGAAIGIAGSALIASAPPFAGLDLPLLIAPLGASAVLLFAVPSSPLVQPWPLVGGNTVSALVGAAAVAFVPEPALAAGLAVGGAIGVMSLLRCLHPPGGGVALMIVLAGPPASLAAAGGFALAPVALNALSLLAIGWAFHRLAGRSYPHRAAEKMHTATEPARGVTAEDVDRALKDLGEPFDISREDLEVLLDRAERHAEARRAAAALPTRAAA